MKQKASNWELSDLATDPSEAINIAAAHPECVDRLARLAQQATSPAGEGTFSRSDRHERDRRAKTGRHDDFDEPKP